MRLLSRHLETILDGTMTAQTTRRTREFRPRLTDLEDRRLLSVAVVEVGNQSSYNITASYRWSSTSSWTTFTESPGQGMLFWTNNTGNLTPQVRYNTTSQSSSQTTYTLAQGYGVWTGTGTPPVSAAQNYQFQNTTTGVQISYVSNAAPSAPTLSASASSSTQATLSWNNVSSATGFYVDVQVNGVWSVLGTVPAGSTGCTVSGLSANTTYNFKVGAFNASGTTWSNVKSVTTAGQPAPLPNEPAAATAYTPVTGTLFATSGPSYLDVRQGNEGDCWLLSSFAAVAARYPQDIQNMFTYQGTTTVNGSTVGQYKVRFYNSAGVANYVTVDTELPSGGTYYDQPVNSVLWVSLAEKAYAEANAAGYVTTQYPGINSYDALNGGDPAWAIQAITGSASSYMVTDFSNLPSAWASGKVIVIGTGANPSSSQIVPGHAYAVVGYNASSSSPFTVYNPWGPSNLTYQGHSVYGLFTAGISFLNQNFVEDSIGTGVVHLPDVHEQSPTRPTSNTPQISFGASIPDSIAFRPLSMLRNRSRA